MVFIAEGESEGYCFNESCQRIVRRPSDDAPFERVGKGHPFWLDLDRAGLVDLNVNDGR
jgi:hypothetical protein